jgi:hypothetical protein
MVLVTAALFTLILLKNVMTTDYRTESRTFLRQSGVSEDAIAGVIKPSMKEQMAAKQTSVDKMNHLYSTIDTLRAEVDVLRKQTKYLHGGDEFGELKFDTENEKKAFESWSKLDVGTGGSHVHADAGADAVVNTGAEGAKTEAKNPAEQPSGDKESLGFT